MTVDAGRRERIEDSDSVKVCVRIRPLSSKERQEQTKSCVRIADSIDGLTSSSSSTPTQQLVVGRDRAFTFDTILGITSSQTDMYRSCVEPLVQGFLEGYNATVLAYGQTGTGKTYTMAGSGFDARGHEKSEATQGIIPRVIKAVFRHLQGLDGDNQHKNEYTLRVEYIEIYNEELRDLLHPETTSKQLCIREDGGGNIVIAGAKSEPADTKEAVFRHLVVGGASRQTASTLMNEQSSRSHAIFSLLLEQHDDASGARRCSKFHLVDLAGSERAKRTGAVAGRFKESVSINQGLLALGNVISALGDDKRRVGTAGGGSGAVHVPYRDSKLTRLLQDSLGGNSRTLMIACVSPASVNFEETLNTLKYANRAKNIKNKPIVNQQAVLEQQRSDETISRMKEEIANLQTQLQQQTAASTPPSGSLSSRRQEKRAAVDDSQLESISRELAQNAKCVRQYSDAVESMRNYSMEAATLLVALERDVTPLGRPVQQRLNEIVKLLNAAIQTAHGSDASAKKLLATPRPAEEDNLALSEAATPEHDEEEETVVVQQLRMELKTAKTDLARDEQIFEMKNAELQRLQALLMEAKTKNDKLIARVQELERGGQLWSNAGMAQIKATSNGKSTLEMEDEDADEVPETAERRTPRSSSTSGKTSSSRGLFERRAGTAVYDGGEDSVLMDHLEEEKDTEMKSGSAPAAPRKGALRNGSSAGFRGAVVVSRGESCGRLTPAARLKTGEALAKMERTVASLQTKVEELQHQNGELLDAREESTRRWALERQNYERQLGETEQALEALRRANEGLEDAMLEEKQADVQYHKSSSPTHLSNSRLELKADEKEPRPDTAASEKKEKKAEAERLDGQMFMSTFERSVQQLVEYQAARQQVLRLLKHRKQTARSKSAASRRRSALEMQKMRRSLDVRESISDLSKSVRALDEKTKQTEARSLEELARLKKLRARAERKLSALRQQEESANFLEGEAQQELLDLEELLVDLDSHIAFQDSELAAARKDLAVLAQRAEADGDDAKSPLDALASDLAQQLCDVDAQEATLVMRKCLENTARLRLRGDELGSQVQTLQSTLEQREATVAQLESGLAVARDEFDRRLGEQQREHALALARLKKLQPEEQTHDDGEWQKLVVRCQKKDEYIGDLEKHLVFYKSKAKQMQAQLQQLIRASNDQRSGDEDEGGERERQLQRRVQQLEDANDALMKDLATAKIYLRASQSRSTSGSVSSSIGSNSAKVVRVSKSELRELPAPPSLTPAPASHVADPREE